MKVKVKSSCLKVKGSCFQLSVVGMQQRTKSLCGDGDGGADDVTKVQQPVLLTPEKVHLLI